MRTYTSPLTTEDLLRVCYAHPAMRKINAGVYPLDALSSLRIGGQRPKHIVYNTARSNEGPGLHWISVILNTDFSAEVFDSLGNRPHQREVIDFLHRHSCKSVYNNTRVQSLNSNTCGIYSLCHALSKIEGLCFESWVGCFTRDTAANDRYVQCIFLRKLAWPGLFSYPYSNWGRVITRACTGNQSRNAGRCERSPAWKIKRPAVTWSN